jgi:hypothetical protein
MFCEVLAFQDRLTLCDGAGVPVPLSVSTVVEGCALLVNVSVPLAAPVVRGLKVTVNEVLWPAGIVTGKERPPMLNTELLELAAVIVTFAPLAVKLPEALPLVPTTTLPRFKVVGLTVSCPTAALPVPESGIVRLGLEAFEVTVTLPLALPAEAGVNMTVKLALWPDVRVTGVEMPLKLNPVPLIATCEIVTLAPPVLVTVSNRDWLLPTVTLPKLRLVGFDPNVPGATPEPDNGIFRLGFEALEVILTLPLALPAEAGVNVTVNVALWPDVRVTGVEMPLKLNPAPLTAT